MHSQMSRYRFLEQLEGILVGQAQLLVLLQGTGAHILTHCILTTRQIVHDKQQYMTRYNSR